MPGELGSGKSLRGLQPGLGLACCEPPPGPGSAGWSRDGCAPLGGLPSVSRCAFEDGSSLQSPSLRQTFVEDYVLGVLGCLGDSAKDKQQASHPDARFSQGGDITK